MIDYSRHEDVFHPVKFGDRRVDVIGVGATGSKVALSLAKLGVKNIHVWDADFVEAHNIANQVYDLQQIGQSKALALADTIEAMTDTKVTVHEKMYEGERDVGEIVFAMVDSMSARRLIFDNLRFAFGTKLVIDPRMGAESAQLYSYDPRKTEQRSAYEATLFSDDDAHVEVSACGTAITVGPTGDIISGYAVWQFLRFVAEQETLPEIHVGAREPGVIAL